MARKKFTPQGPGAGARRTDYNPKEVGKVKVKTVEVPYATQPSGVDLSAPVTVSKAPWDDDETDN